MEIQKTEFYNDFLHYYNKAKILQFRNKEINNLNEFELEEMHVAVNDPLMLNVHIYDCIDRRQAGFSNALQDIHGKREPKEKAKLPIFTKKDNKILTRFIHLFHRFTGSGASFESDHGYRNSHVKTLCRLADNAKTDESALLRMKAYIVDCNKPMVTSKGNQPPSLKNPDKQRYRLAMQYYFDNFAEDFIKDYSEWIDADTSHRGNPVPITAAVDFCLAWHKKRGFKQWKFVLTAFVMDDAEYFPLDVDPNSHCYFGSNCIKAFELMFTKPKGRVNKQEWHDKCMDMLVQDTGGQPYSLEDVACDMIRYWTEFVPKKDYEHLEPHQKRNNSLLKINGEYPDHIKQRIIEVCGD